MDATHRMVCGDGLVNPLSSMGVQVSCMLVISHFFNIVLRTLGQPGPIAQILAGLLLGPSALLQSPEVQKIFFLYASTNYYEVVSFFCRIFFMFLFGLQTDIHYIMRNLRVASLVASGGAVMGGIFGLSVSFYLYQQIGDGTEKKNFFVTIMLVIAYTSSPTVIRLVAELRFAASNVGRIAVSSALITEMICLLLHNLVLNGYTGNLPKGFACLFITVVVILFNRFYAIKWLNKRHRNEKYLRAPQVLFILLLLVASSVTVEILGFNSIISCFLIGLLFPKEGKTARTLIHKLGYSIYNFILPVYFGYVGFQCNLSVLKASWNEILCVVILILLSIGGKLTGVLIVCRYLKIPTSEGIFIGFIMNTRGYADLLFIGAAAKPFINFSPKGYDVLSASIVLNTILTGIIVAFLTRGEERLLANHHTALEVQGLEDELRILACVYDPRQISILLAIVLALDGSGTSTTISYLMHLIELVKKSKSNLLYHQKENADLSDDDDYGGSDEVEINEAVDAFTSETKILIRQRKAVSSFHTLYEDVCNDAEDQQVAVVLLPFHKHQRIDGKMESGKEGIRTTNQKVLRHAPCTVGVIVERGLSTVPGFSQLIAPVGSIQNVATLFFGGPDDREAIAWSIRIAKHPRINLSVIRFLLAPSAEKDQTESEVLTEEKEILMSLSGDETVHEMDNAFMVDFYNRYVTSGQIGYVEKYVNNGAQTVAALKDIGDMYSLFIVGKGSRGHCSLTIGMSDWEESPELGTVGDVLATSDFNIHGSVLVIQQYRHADRGLV